mgnify:CR=1 FL=1|tara:strand:+ start:640 stop:903 length:264 start_codon:yes stop_codon:yes gene_type:complete
MSDYDNNNRGAIWGNDKKVKDTQPDFTGSIMVDGKDYFVSGWKRKADASPKSPALSLAVTLKDQQPQRSAPAQSPSIGNDDLEDIPF